MIIAWVISLILVITSIIGYLEHGAALKIRLLAIETAAHRQFVESEKNLSACEAQLPHLPFQLEALTVSHRVDAQCEYQLLDQDATGKLIRIRAGVSGDRGAHAQLESIAYFSPRDHSSTRASWRWVAPNLQGK